MSTIIGEVSIPADDQGFVLMQCPLCGEFFKIKPGDYHAEDVIEIWCPSCGLKAENYFTDDVIELALKKTKNYANDLIYNEMKKWEKKFKGSFISFKAGKKPQHEEEYEVMERLIDTLMELQKKESTDLPLLKKQLAETEKGINNMLNAIQAGIFTPSTKQRLDELEETKSQLEVSILQEEMHKPLLTREQIAFFIYRFRKFDVTKREQRQRLIDSFVNAVYLYEDKIILTFNYKDGSKTITLAEVEGSDLSVLGAPNRNTIRQGGVPFLLCKSVAK
mgnify:CR=1 FL=1